MVVEPSVAGVELVVDDDGGTDVDVSGTVVSVVDVVVFVIIVPGNDVGLENEPTSIPSVIACMYLCQIVAGNVPPKTTRPCTLVMFRGVSFGPLRYPIHTAVV